MCSPYVSAAAGLLDVADTRVKERISTGKTTVSDCHQIRVRVRVSNRVRVAVRLGSLSD